MFFPFVSVDEWVAMTFFDVYESCFYIFIGTVQPFVSRLSREL